MVAAAQHCPGNSHHSPALHGDWSPASCTLQPPGSAGCNKSTGVMTGLLLRRQTHVLCPCSI